MDSYIVNSGLVYDSHGREALGAVYRQYIDIGFSYDLPMITLAPTWRANPERIRKSGFNDKIHLNADCVRFLDDIRQSYGAYASTIYVGGCCGTDNRHMEETAKRIWNLTNRIHSN